MRARTHTRIPDYNVWRMNFLFWVIVKKLESPGYRGYSADLEDWSAPVTEVVTKWNNRFFVAPGEAKSTGQLQDSTEHLGEHLV